MKAKLVDFRREEEETEFGTCELCMSTGIAIYESMKFEYDDGYTEWVDLYFWSWGDLIVLDGIDNTANFAAWLQTQELDGYIRDFNTLQNLAYAYEEETDDR